MHPDLFITIAFVSLVAAFALAGLAIALHERRREWGTAEQDAAAQKGSGKRSAATADRLEGRPAPRRGSTTSVPWRLKR
jgi:hypothetical protein